MNRNTPDILSTPSDIAELAKALSNSPFIGIDTEMDSFFCYHEKVCLLQISNEDTDYLVDPLAADLSPLIPIFADDKHTAIFHAGENDIPHLRKEHGLVFARVFDTYIAAGFLQYATRSLAGLLQMHFDVVQDKRYQKANWNIRPIPDDMAQYALYDTRFFIPLREILYNQLVEQNLLDDAEQAFLHASQAVINEKVFCEDNWSRIKGLERLPNNAHGIVKSLYIWREHIADTTNTPPFRVMPDYIIIKLALARPTSQEQLVDMLTESGRSRLSRQNIKDLHQAISQGIALGSIPVPKHKSRNAEGYSPAQQAIYRRLKDWRNAKCEQCKLTTEQVMSNRQLKLVLQAAPQSPEALIQIDSLTARQIDQYGTDLLEIMQKKATAQMKPASWH